MIELLPFKADDLLLIKAREPYPGFSIAMELERRGPALTAWLAGKPIGAAGIAKLWKGVGEAWAFVGPEAAARPIWMTKTIRQYIRRLREEMGLSRVQVYARYYTVSWAARFFDAGLEAQLKHYFPDGEDAFLMAWIKP
jgi:hypothetical protein